MFYIVGRGFIPSFDVVIMVMLGCNCLIFLAFDAVDALAFGDIYIAIIVVHDVNAVVLNVNFVNKVINNF